jgi:acetyl esterase/lipase
MTIEREVPYSDEYTDRRVMDWFIPVAANHRGMLFIHGGGWSGGDKQSWHEVAGHYCDLGYTCASAEYRLVPQTDFIGQITDVRLAMAAFRDRAGEIGFEIDRIAVVGSSAGGHLVAMLATLEAADELCTDGPPNGIDTIPNAVICYCPVLAVYDTGSVRGFFNDAARAMLGGTFEDNPQLFRQATPLDRITGREPPFLFLHGDADEQVPLSHSTEMHRQLIEAGAISRLVVVPGAPHGFGYGVESAHQKTSLKHVALFLDTVFTTR